MIKVKRIFILMTPLFIFVPILLMRSTYITSNKKFMALFNVIDPDNKTFDSGINNENPHNKISDIVISDGNPNTKTSDNEVKPIRLLCFVPINPKTYEDKTKVIRRTWGKRCDKLLFFAKVNVTEDQSIGQTVDLHVNEGKRSLYGKIRMGFQYLYNNYLNDYDWFLKADDDTYCIVDNLRYVLTPYQNADFPIAFGADYIHKGGGADYNHKDQKLKAGGAYVLSRGALKNLVEIAYQNPLICQDQLTGFLEDVRIGRCLQNSGVLFGDSRDNFGKHRFYQHPVDEYIAGKWLYRAKKGGLIVYPLEKGIDSISKTVVSFHKMKDSSRLYELEFLIYELQVYGVNRMFTKPIPALLPPNKEAIPQEVLNRLGHPDTK